MRMENSNFFYKTKNPATKLIIIKDKNIIIYIEPSSELSFEIINNNISKIKCIENPNILLYKEH